MKSLGLVLTLMISTFGSQARAQEGSGAGLADFLYSVAAFDGSLGVAGLVTGLGSSTKVAQGKFSKPWFVASYVTGGLNLVLGGLEIGFADEFGYRGNGAGVQPVFAAIAAAHAAVGLWNVVMATIGFYRGEPAPTGATFAPVVLTGRGGSGHRWSGLGVQIANF